AHLLKQRSRIALIVVDGLGYRRLVTALPGGTLCAHLRGSLTSVFPSTTASAITSLLTGLAPAQHGITGWHMRFAEQATTGAVLPFRERVSDRPLGALGIDPRALFAYCSLFERLPVHSYALAPERIQGSVFNRAHCAGAEQRGYSSLEQLFGSILSCLRAHADRCYIYAYYAEYDSVAQEYGADSRHALRLLQRMDQAFAAFLDAASGLDVNVVLTADHGFVNSPFERTIDLDQHPALHATLRAPL